MVSGLVEVGDGEGRAGAGLLRVKRRMEAGGCGWRTGLAGGWSSTVAQKSTDTCYKVGRVLSTGEDVFRST